MDYSLFDLSRFNVIEDENYYYVFRAIEPGDIDDMKSGKATPSTIRPYKDRYNEEKGEGASRYSDATEISLVEIWDHIRKNFYPGTNCISFTSNASVAIDYGAENRYLIKRISKKNMGKSYPAARYMMEELDKILEKKVSGLTDTSLLDDIKMIEKASSIEEVKKVLSKYTGNSSYIGKRQDFNNEQNLEFHKLIAKLHILESRGIVENILPRTSSNTSLIATIGMACSSAEVIQYGSGEEDSIMEISPLIIDLFSILQQADSKNISSEKVALLKKKVLELALKGYKLSDNRFGNESEGITIDSIYDLVLRPSNYKLNDSISIKTMYEITKGRIPYSKARRTLEFTYEIAKSKQKVLELCEVLRTIAGDSSFDSVIDEISRECYAVSTEIISRLNNQGEQISESVNIDINGDNGHLFELEDQRKIIQFVLHMTSDEKYAFFKSNGIDVEKKLCTEVLTSEDSEISLNRYYAETIFGRIDFRTIYRSGNNNRVISTEEQEILISYFESINCERVYNAFLEAGINENDIPYYFINLVLNRGIGGFLLEQLDEVEDINKLIKDNIHLINKKVSVYRLDRLFKITDEVMVDGLLVPLRDYQDLAVKKLDLIYERKNFAGVVLPTGGGKSFVAMTEMLKRRNEPMIYYAPRRNILYQIQEHIIRNICGLRILSEEEEAYYLGSELPIPEGTILFSDIEQRIREVFPYLEMKCYNEVLDKDEDFFKNKNCSFIILDEAHRIAGDESREKGALKFQRGIMELIRNNPNAKVLAITATPVRDVDSVDAIKKYARVCGSYTAEEIRNGNYLAINMEAPEAMQSGYIVTPNVVTFDYTLEESDEYKTVKAMYEMERDPFLKERYRIVYEGMREIISKGKNLGIDKIIEEALVSNNKPKNGKYIVFLPRNEFPAMSTEEYIRMRMAEIVSYFKGIDPDAEASYLFSGRQDKSQNEKAIRKFQQKSPHLQLIFSIDMLNEGSHFDDVDGVLLFRPLTPGNKILYSQQTGRCIFSIDPETKLELSRIPIIFDLYNSYLSQNMNREVNRHSNSSDLDIMRRAEYWIYKHKRFPDVDSDSTTEVKVAAALKRIQLKYERYVSEPELLDRLGEESLFQIKEIIRIGKNIDLWMVDIPERKQANDVVDAYRLKGTQLTFIELYKQFEEMNQFDFSTRPASSRIIAALNVLEIFEEYGVEISPSLFTEKSTIQDILSKLDFDVRNAILNQLEESLGYPIGREYLYVRKMYYAAHPVFNDYNPKMLNRLGIYKPFVEDKKIGKSQEWVTLIDENGFIVKGPKKHLSLHSVTGTRYNEQGYDITGIDEKNFRQNEVLNKYHFDRDGYYYELDSDNHYVKTDSKLDPRGFDIKGDYYEKDENGVYKKIGKLDRHGFNIDGIYCRYNSDNEIVVTGSMIDEFGFTVRGNYTARLVGSSSIEMEDGLVTISNRTLYRKRIEKYPNGRKCDRIETDLPYDFHYFDRDGYYYELGEDGERHKTDRKYNDRFFDRLGRYYELGPDGKRYPSATRRWDDHFFGLDDFYYEETPTGFVKTNSKKDKDGFNRQGLKIINIIPIKNSEAFDRDGFLYLYDPVERNYKKVIPETKIDQYGFDSNGDHHVKDANGNYTEEIDGRLTPNGYDIERRKIGKATDERGFNIDNLISVNGKRRAYDRDFFDVDGYYYSFTEDRDVFINKFMEYVEWHVGPGKKTVTTIELLTQFLNHYKEPLFKTNKKYNYRFFDCDGYYWKLVVEDGKKKRVKTKSKVDPRGFDASGRHYVLNPGPPAKYVLDMVHPNVDENGFDAYGFYHKKSSPFGKNRQISYILTSKLYDEHGFDKNGFYCEERLNPDTGRYMVYRTNSKCDKHGFDRNGFYHEIDSDGKRKKESSGRLYDERHFDIDGNYCIVNARGEIIGRKPTHPSGFDIDKICYATKKIVDEHGFDIDGFYCEEKINPSTGVVEYIRTTSRINSYGFDREGFYHEIGPNGERKEESSGKKENTRGFKSNKINTSTNSYVDENGFDIDGLFYSNYSEAHSSKNDDIPEDYKPRVYNNRFFDVDGYYYEENEEGIRVKTDRKYDDYGFDLSGYYWSLNADGTRIKTDSRYDENGYDSRGFNKKGINRETNKKYDKRGFDSKGVNKYTNTELDIFGNNINGVKISNGKADCKMLILNNDSSIQNTVSNYLTSNVSVNDFIDNMDESAFDTYMSKTEKRAFFFKMILAAIIKYDSVKELAISKIEKLSEKLTELQERIEKLKQEINSFTPGTDMNSRIEYQRLINRLKKEESDLKLLKEEKSKISKML